MKRLTGRDEFGNADIRGVASGDLQLPLTFEGMNRVTDALNRLADYEDSGLTPEEVAALAKREHDSSQRHRDDETTPPAGADNKRRESR